MTATESGDASLPDTGAHESGVADSGFADRVSNDSGVDGGLDDAPSDTGLDARDDGGVCAEGLCLANGKCVPPGGPIEGCCKCSRDVCVSPCVCAAPETPIATPSGPRPIASLRVGDLVYSVHRGHVVAVPLRAAGRSRVPTNHQTVRLTLTDGTALRISPGHPTADGRRFVQLRRGDRIDHAVIADAQLVSYDEPYTYDVLPDSDTATYFAGGVLIGSTLRPVGYPASVAAP